MSTISAKMLQATGGQVIPYWIALLGGLDEDDATAVAVDSADNVIVVGNTNSVEDVNTRLIIKYNSSGGLQWSRTLGGASGVFASASAVAIDSEDSIVVTGSNGSVTKYNSSGVIQWSRTLGGAGSDIINAVTIDSGDNIIITGSTQSAGPGLINLLIAKYNSSGVLQWSRTLGSTPAGLDFGIDISYAVAIDSGDNIVIAGSTVSAGAGNIDISIAKYNSSGVIQWNRTLSSTGNEVANGVAIDSNNNIILTGYINVGMDRSNEFLVAKCNSSGILQWSRTLSSTLSEVGRGVVIDSDDDIIVAGTTTTVGLNEEAILAKYNSSGALQWSRALSGTGSEFVRGVAINSNSDIIIAGYTNSDGAGDVDFLTAKLPSDGSGTGTYGSLTYQEDTLTDAAVVLTNGVTGLIDGPSGLPDTAGVFTVGSPDLSEEFFVITP